MTELNKVSMILVQIVSLVNKITISLSPKVLKIRCHLHSPFRNGLMDQHQGCSQRCEGGGGVPKSRLNKKSLHFETIQNKNSPSN